MPLRLPPVRVGWTSYMTSPMSLLIDTDATWGGGSCVANQAYYIPFYADHTITLTQFWWVTSTGASTTNVDVGIYDRTGTRLISTGAVSRGTEQALNTSNVSDTIIVPGHYYMAFSTSGTQNFVVAGSINGSRARESGFAIQASAHPLPATFTLATFTTQVVPHFGFDTSWTP